MTSQNWKGVAVAVLGVGVMTVLIRVVPGADRVGNVSILYLLVVLLTALRFGGGPAIVASVLAFLAIDWNFVDPRHTLTVHDPAEWIALVMFLIIATVTGHLTATARRQADEARVLAREAAALAQVEARAQALAEADRLKTALLSLVSHDFRSPLASIKASATACIQGDAAPDPAAQRELNLGIIQEADRLNGIVENILAMSRLEADAWRPQFEEAAVEEVVEAARSGLSRENDRRIQVALPEGEDDVWLDPVQIGQVLHNLLDNALKYSPGDRSVDLQVRNTPDHLVFEVSDRGPGLPKGDEDRIFDRFYRAPELRESAVPGVGIGLSVCRGLVEAHGGQLTAANRPGGGAVFTVRLPRKK